VSEVGRHAADLDRVIHEPARLTLTALLYGAEEADFLFLLAESGLTRGNLASHMAKLEEAGYVEVEKSFVGRIPRTVYRLTPAGREAFRRYRQGLRRLSAALG
jgi:DNA-binding MarR family transcriptional regulator